MSSEREHTHGAYALGIAVVATEIDSFAEVEFSTHLHARCHIPKYVYGAAYAIFVFIG